MRFVFWIFFYVQAFAGTTNVDLSGTASSFELCPGVSTLGQTCPNGAKYIGTYSSKKWLAVAAETGSTYNYANAVTYCNSLNIHGISSGWTVPTWAVFQSMIYPAANFDAFAMTQNTYWLSDADSYAGQSTGVTFNNGCGVSTNTCSIPSHSAYWAKRTDYCGTATCSEVLLRVRCVKSY